MHITREETLQIFEEAGRLGQKGDRWTRMDPSLRGSSTTVSASSGAEELLKSPPMQMVQLPSYTQTTAIALYVPKLPSRRVAPCSCGGWFERRLGLARLIHVGGSGCKAPRKANGSLPWL